jgi:hypothetical protein
MTGGTRYACVKFDLMRTGHSCKPETCEVVCGTWSVAQWIFILCVWTAEGVCAVCSCPKQQWPLLVKNSKGIKRERRYMQRLSIVGIFTSCVTAEKKADPSTCFQMDKASPHPAPPSLESQVIEVPKCPGVWPGLYLYGSVKTSSLISLHQWSIISSANTAWKINQKVKAFYFN